MQNVLECINRKVGTCFFNLPLYNLTNMELDICNVFVDNNLRYKDVKKKKEGGTRRTSIQRLFGQMKLFFFLIIHAFTGPP